MATRRQITFFLMIVVQAIAVSAYGSTLINGPITIGNGTFAPSNNVTLQAKSTSANYTAGSKHLNGNRLFGTNNVNNKIYWLPFAPGTTCPSIGTATQDFVSQGWNTL